MITHFAVSRVLFAVSSLLLALSLHLSCSDNRSNPIIPPGGGGTPISDDLRMAVLDSLTSRINQLPQVDADADNQTILAYARTRPEFSASGIRKSGVWAQFQDGRSWTFANNLSGADTAWPEPPLIAKIASLKKSLAAAEDLPQNARARVMNALGSAFDYSGFGQLGFTEAADNIKSWLMSAGYTPVVSAPTVDELRTVSGDGVFYCSTHGDTVLLPDGSRVYGMWTGTQVTAARDSLYDADLDSGRISYFTAAHTRGGIFSRDISETHYAITHKFVRSYMSFGPRSVVFINGCLSGDQSFRDACTAKGADLYLGWSNYVDAYRAARIAQFYFDRALGANIEAPVLSPPQKGYQLYDVTGFMQTTGRDFTMHKKYGRANLLSYPPTSSAAWNVTMLRPLIYSADASANEFVILGWFGPNPGAGAATVMVGATAVPILSWGGASTINCGPVQNGGDVVVTVNGIRSHPVPLTKFSGTFDYTYHGRGSLTQKVSVTFEFLANVRTNRVRVDEAPQWQLPRPIFVLNSTGGTFEASGEYRNQQGDLVETWTGSGSLTHGPLTSSTTSNRVNISGVIDKTGFMPSAITVGLWANYQTNGAPAVMSIQYDVGTLSTQMSDAFYISGASYTGASGTNTWTGTFSNVIPEFAPAVITVR